MGFKVVIRIRGYTDWILYGYTTSKFQADLLVEELEDRVQIVTLPTDQDLKELEDKIGDKTRYIFPNGGKKDGPI